jgi:RND family efflux transporter MFP subunit
MPEGAMNQMRNAKFHSPLITRRLSQAVWCLLAIAVIAGCGNKESAYTKTTAAVPVQIAIARLGSMTSNVEVSGDIKASKSAALSAKMPARVIAVPYREGDRVSASAVVVQQDVTDLNAQVRQAEAGVLAARSHLSQAITAAGLSDTQTEAGIAQAKAAFGGAQENFKMVKNGARPQEVEAARSGVDQAQANFKNAKATLERMRGLYSEGALAKQQMELVQLQYDVAKAQLDGAKQQLSLVKEGARVEQIQAAQTQVDQAAQGVIMAKSNRSNRALREEDIKSARAGVVQAEAALAFAKLQVRNAYITSPISGVVSKRYIQPGEQANPGQPLIEVVAPDSVYFEAMVSEMDVAKVKVGQTVQVGVDALSGKRFVGTVEKVLPSASTSSREFTVRVKVLNPAQAGGLKPGMFAHGSIEVAKHNNAVIIPKDALITDNNKDFVYRVVAGKARLRPVTIGFQTRENAEVLSGLEAGGQVVTIGHDKLSDGVSVHGTN